MSKPIKHWNGPMGFFAASGYYVLASAYDALAAENERLRKDIMEISNAAKMVSEIGIKAADELTMLKDQNERLRKAGDAMANCIRHGLPNSISDSHQMAWNAAKEGGAK